MGENGDSRQRYSEVQSDLVPVYDLIAALFDNVRTWLTIDDEFDPLAVQLCNVLRSVHRESHNGHSINGDKEESINGHNGSTKFYIDTRDANRVFDVTQSMSELRGVRLHPSVESLVYMTGNLVISSPASIEPDLRKYYAGTLIRMGYESGHIRSLDFFANGTAKTTK